MALDGLRLVKVFFIIGAFHYFGSGMPFSFNVILDFAGIFLIFYIVGTQSVNFFILLYYL